MPGLYPVRAELALTGSHVPMPPAWRQVVEDVCVVTVGTPADDSLLRLVSEPEPVDVNAGETARLAVTVGTDAHADLAVEAHLISPWGTWEWMGPAVIGAELPARGTVELGFDVAPPAVGGSRRMVGADPGRLRRSACLLLRGEGDGAMSVAATVGGVPVFVDEVDAREDRLRAHDLRRRCHAAAPAKAGSCDAG